MPSLLCKTNPFKWESTHDMAFNSIKHHIENIATTHHYDINLPIRIVFDASDDGVGATLEQCEALPWQWRPFAFGYRFLNAAELKHSANEIELLAVVFQHHQSTKPDIHDLYI